MLILPEPSEEDLELLTLRVFLKSVEILGGLSKLVEQKKLTWLSSLAVASYCVVLREEYFKSEKDIAEGLGIPLQTVRNILRSEPPAFGELQTKELSPKARTAGGIAKLAYRLVKEGQEESNLFLKYCQMATYALDIPWAYMVLRKLRRSDFPIKSAESLSDRLKGIYIKGRTAEEVLSELDYPIKSSAELLYRLKENLKMHGLD